MKQRRYRLSLTVLSTILFLGITFQPEPSDPAIPRPDQMPRPDEQAALQELAEWVVKSPAEESPLQVMTPGDLEAALSPDPEPREPTLFQREPTPEERRRFLRDLPFGSAVVTAAERHEVDSLLVAAIVEAESGFSPERISPKGAVGLMQVLPSTAAAYGDKDLFDPHVNLDVGSRYLSWLLREFRGDLRLAVAAYNAGPGAVERYHGIPPYRETRQYVKRVLKIYDEHRRDLEASRLPAASVRNGA